jgi:two-component system, NtrC family, sensor kinase
MIPEIKKSLHVFIVDDSIAVVKYINEMFSESFTGKIESEFADSLDSAFKKLETFDCDVILLDLNIKDSMGLETLIKMKQKYSNIPIVVMTGEYADDIGYRAIAMGAQDFLIKNKIEGDSFYKTIHYAIERKRIERELLGFEAKWRSLVQNTSDIIINISQDGKILFINRDTSWFTVNDSIGQDIYNFFSTENRGKIKRAIDIVFQFEKILDFEIRVVQSDNSFSWYFFRISPILEKNHIIAANMTITDITERKNIENELRESEQRYRILFQASGDGILIINIKDMKIKYANPAMSTMLGYAENELIGLDVSRIHPHESYKSIISEINAQGKGKKKIAGNIPCLRKDGAIFYTDINSVFSEIDGVKCNLAFFRDVTERRQREEQRISMEKQLRQSRTFESIGTLASGIAHEINTPMQYIQDNTLFFSEGIINIFEIINTYQKLIKENIQYDNMKEIQEKIDKVLKDVDIDYLRQEIPSAIKQSLEGIDRVKKIINAMRYFSHVDAEAMTMADINKAIESAVLVTKNVWKFAADIKTDLDPLLPEIKCFISEINQVMMNLIVNSSNAISDVFGDGANGKGLINISSRKNTNTIIIAVKDNGTGIPEKIKDRIFDPFFTTKDVGKGTGQGLSIVYDVIVNKHKGKIDVNSKVDEGTTFTIQLPINN